ncbi:hypothetical protein CLOM_g3579 [Closterium sp. NIES-68]|nr:hypothetical protein CLOM_g3579 [Closterium sp. NIES-68]GJP69861.1 hypothetical protein CLOP_g867 [Closterium sp. NIES-67]
MTAPLAGPKCKNRFPKYPLCKFVNDMALGFKPTVVDGASGKTLTIAAFQIYHKFHRDLPETKQYAYGVDEKTASYPGPIVVAKKGVPTKVYWQNKLLDKQHMFTVDYTLMPMMAKPKQGGIPMVVHRHGGEQSSLSDGHPDAWITQFGETGPTFNSNLYRYGNKQSASLIWYHDHTLGWTRLNTVAGLAGGWIIVDPQGEEKNLQFLPQPGSARYVPLILADRSFFANGSIDYPNVGIVPNVHPNWIPEYFGNHILVNGLVWPFQKVRRALYRFRVLGGANARVYNLKFTCAGRGDYPNFFPPLKGPTLDIIQIGSDGGYLESPVRISTLLVLPGERMDILVDFNTAPSYCKDVILTNDARAPYPAGEPADANTGVVMRFVITNRQKIPTPSIPSTLVSIPKVDLGSVVKVRYNTLVEIMDAKTQLPIRVTIDGKMHHDTATEIAKEGSTELWNIINLSADAHAMHLHLIQHRAISRRPFDIAGYQSGKCSFTDKTKPSCYTGAAVAVDINERGWKDTTLSLPGQVLTIYTPFYQQSGAKQFEFDPSRGPGYVWHCHMLEHEENDMMRPLLIVK